VSQIPTIDTVNDINSPAAVVTIYNTNQMTQFDAYGDELRRVQLSRHMYPHHAVESPTGTFIVSLGNAQMKLNQLVEVNTGGEVLNLFSNMPGPVRSLCYIEHVAIDSRGNIFLQDSRNHHIQLFDARLSLRGVIINEHQLNYKEPSSLCYRERSGQLLVGLIDGVAVFDVLHR